MQKLVAFCLLLTFSFPALAVEDGQVIYLGGSAPGVSAGVVGRLDTTSDKALVFEYSGNKLAIPYDSIQSFEYSKEVTRHLGVLPAIGSGCSKCGGTSIFSVFRIAIQTMWSRSPCLRFLNTCRAY